MGKHCCKKQACHGCPLGGLAKAHLLLRISQASACDCVAVERGARTRAVCLASIDPKPTPQQPTPQRTPTTATPPPQTLSPL